MRTNENPSDRSFAVVDAALATEKLAASVIVARINATDLRPFKSILRVIFATAQPNVDVATVGPERVVMGLLAPRFANTPSSCRLPNRSSREGRSLASVGMVVNRGSFVRRILGD